MSNTSEGIKPPGRFNNWAERRFQLAANGTNVRTEIIAGTATFLAAAAMPAVQPAVLGAAGMDKTAVFWATTLVLILSALGYALWINYPFVCGPSIGVSPWVSYYIVRTLGVPWEIALTCVFISGILFLLLSLVGFREKIMMAIPMGLKHAFGAGIGAFITTVGLLGTGIIKTDPEAFFGLSLGNLTAAPTVGAIVTIFIISFFIVRNIKGGFLFGIFAFTIAGFFITDPSTGAAISHWGGGSIVSISNPFHALAPTLGKAVTGFSLDALNGIFGNVWMGLGVIIFTFFFIVLFDTIGTVSGLATLAGYIDPKTGEVPKMQKVFLMDAGGTTIGSLLGVSTVVTYVESSVGVAEGGRTGLASLWIAILFTCTLFFAPVFTMIPGVASSAAISVIGAMMMKSVLNIHFEDFSEALPAFFCIFMMPFTGNMGIGIMCGIFTFTILKSMAGKREEVNPVLWILSALFVVYIISQRALT